MDEILWYCVVCGKPVTSIPLTAVYGQRDDAIVERTICGIGCYNECNQIGSVEHGKRCFAEAEARRLNKPELIYWRHDGQLKLYLRAIPEAKRAILVDKAGQVQRVIERKCRHGQFNCVICMSELILGKK